MVPDVTVSSSPVPAFLRSTGRTVRREAWWPAPVALHAAAMYGGFHVELPAAKLAFGLLAALAALLLLACAQRHAPVTVSRTVR